MWLDCHCIALPENHGLSSQKLSILPKSGWRGTLVIYAQVLEEYSNCITPIEHTCSSLMSCCMAVVTLLDIKRATDITYKAVAEYGLNQTLQRLLVVGR
ncbi:hypothetical protein SDJN03_15607, partial [Cucurbita argyrosperma subsp. sororia]